MILLFQKLQNSLVKWTNILSNYIQKGRKNNEDTDWILKRKIIPRVLIKNWLLKFPVSKVGDSGGRCLVLIFIHPKFSNGIATLTVRYIWR